jgi:putative membrane protein
MGNYAKAIFLAGVLAGAGAVQADADAQLRLASQDGAIPATFVKKATMDGLTEVELGKIALLKSRDENVRTFAEHLIDDHGKANEALASIARKKGIRVPTALDTQHKSLVQSLNAKSGKAFDAAYGVRMDAENSRAIALFQGAITGPDADLAAFAKKTLPTLEQHKEMAERLSTSRTPESLESPTHHE